jgi:hypothetical protein
MTLIIISMFASIRQSMLWASWIQFLSVLLFAAWLYFTGKQLHTQFPAGITVPPGALFLALLLPVSFMGFIALKFTKDYLINDERFINIHRGSDILPSQAFFFGAVLGMLYAIYFVARSIKTVEEGKRIPFYHCLDMFVAVLFFPIGIWVVAPRLNKIIAKPEEPEMDIFKS